MLPRFLNYPIVLALSLAIGLSPGFAAAHGGGGHGGGGHGGGGHGGGGHMGGGGGILAVEVASAVEEERPILVALAWEAWAERVMVVFAAEQWRPHAALGE